jgi:hypothetical protein
VTDAIDGLGFLEEPQHGVAALGVVAAQQLERDLATELDVLGLVHVAHAALAEQLAESVHAERAAEPVVRIIGALAGRRWRLRRCARLGLLRHGGLVTTARRLDARALLAIAAGAHREGRMRDAIVVVLFAGRFDLDRHGCGRISGTFAAVIRPQWNARSRIASRHVGPDQQRRRHQGRRVAR